MTELEDLLLELQDVKLTSFGEEGIGLAAGRDFKACEFQDHCIIHDIMILLETTRGNEAVSSSH